MQQLSSSTKRFLSALSKGQEKAFHIAENNAALRRAIEQTWSNNPEAAAWLLSQINAIYIEKDSAPRKGPAAKQADPAIMKLYVRDSMARTELNARRESLILALSKQGIHVQAIKLCQATGDAKKHQVFPSVNQADIAQQKANLENNKKQIELARHSQQIELLEQLRRAVCLCFDDPDNAYTLLSNVQGAYMEPLKLREGARDIRLWWRARFFVPDENYASMKEVVSIYEDSIKSKARTVGLNLVGISVLHAPNELLGRQAFPRTGFPVPYLK